MFMPVAPTQGHGSVGIGWFIAPFGEKYTVIFKNGGDTWWSSLAHMIPELKLGVVAFANPGFAGDALPSLVVEVSAVCRDPTVPSRVSAATAQGLR
jgi:hypothetical protein